MFRVRKDIQLPKNGKIYFGDEGALFSFNQQQNSIEVKIDNENALNVNKTISEDSSNVNVLEINGNTISTGNGITDDGTQRVCLASDTDQSMNIELINGNTISTGNGITDNGTQRVCLASDTNQNVNISNTSPIYTQKLIDSLHLYRSQLYFDSSITGSSNVHNLAYNLSNSSANEPINTSISFQGGSIILIHSIEIHLLTTKKPPHNTGWGADKSTINGFGIYYKISGNSSEYTLVNDNSSTDALPLDPIKSNMDFFKTFRNWELFDPGSGDLGLNFYKEYDPPLQITNTGGYYLRFKKEDLTANDLITFNVFINYYS